MLFKMFSYACFSVLLLLSITSASITLTYPVSSHFATVVKDADFQGDFRVLASKNLGAVAPGQTLKLVFSRETGSTFLWEKVKSNASASWNERVSLGDSIVLSFIIPQDTAEGEYTINFTGTAAYEPGSVKTPEVLPLVFQVTKNVYSIEAEASYDLYADYPNSVLFKVKSLSLASDVISFTITDFPLKWYRPLKTQFLPLEEKKLFFSVTPAEERQYSVRLSASAESGLTNSFTTTLKVRPATLQTKLKSLSEGFSIIPIILQPFYSLLSLFGLVG